MAGKKKTAKRKTTQRKAPQSEKQILVAEALQITWWLKGQIKTAQIAYLRIAGTLVDIRDRKLYARLGHPDIQDYAAKRLRLGQASLYRYLQVYDWVKESHPAWLEKKAKGFIPELSDANDLMWIEKELKRTDLSASDRKDLAALQAKGLSGALRKSELAEWRGKGKNTDTFSAYLSKFRSFRKRCARISGMPKEVIEHLEAAIEILKNHQETA